MCERLRVNGSPVPPDRFAKHFQHLWRLLNGAKPPFIVLTAVLVLHMSVAEEIDVLVLETSLGGIYDAANVFPAPSATGITLLDFEHVEELGHTIQDIAWHKGGIFKPDVPAFTVRQPIPQAHQALYQRSLELGVSDRKAKNMLIITHCR